MDRRLSRMEREQLQRALRLLQLDRSNGPVTPTQVAALHARMWDKWTPGAKVLEVGREIVCRHAAGEVADEMDQRAHLGYAGFVDLWSTKPQGPYTGHATATVLLEDGYYLVESLLPDPSCPWEGHAWPIRPHPQFEGLEWLTLTNVGGVDVAWYAHRTRRDLVRYEGLAGPQWRRAIRQQYLGHSIKLLQEYGTGEAWERSDGDADDDRKTVI